LSKRKRRGAYKSGVVSTLHNFNFIIDEDEEIDEDLSLLAETT